MCFTCHSYGSTSRIPLMWSSLSPYSFKRTCDIMNNLYKSRTRGRNDFIEKQCLWRRSSGLTTKRQKQPGNQSKRCEKNTLTYFYQLRISFGDETFLSGAVCKILKIHFHNNGICHNLFKFHGRNFPKGGSQPWKFISGWVTIDMYRPKTDGLSQAKFEKRKNFVFSMFNFLKSVT